MQALIDALSAVHGWLHQALFEHLVQPALFALGLASWIEDGFRATEWLLVGCAQLVVMVGVIGPLSRWRPVEPLADRAAVRVDVVYTLIHRLGLFRLALFFTLDPLLDALGHALAMQGIAGFQLDQAVGRLAPGVLDAAWVGFLVYLVFFDAVDYAIHRAQHHFDWWWALHAVHHSQRQMTMWTDSRNHLLDDLLRDLIVVALGHAVGVPPAQFIALVALSQLVENLSHANLRLSFGRLGQRLVVGPRFHRLHHGIGIGHEGGAPGTLGGCNFAVLLPLWDLLFRTARFDAEPGPTGIRDQLPEAGARDYGRGFWAQQRLGLRRLAGRA